LTEFTALDWFWASAFLMLGGAVAGVDDRRSGYPVSGRFLRDLSTLSPFLEGRGRSLKNRYACILSAIVLLSLGLTQAQEKAEFNEHRYELFDNVEKLSWTHAREQCSERGGYLVVVNDQAEADFIAELCDGRYMYLGATDDAKEGEWRWIDGTEWSFTHWMDGQPNDYSGKENYLATYDDGEWVDVDHSGSGFWMPTGYICEWNE